MTWISHGWTCIPHPEPPPSSLPIPPPSPSYPSGLSQCISFECPVSCIELGLVIYFTYGNIRVSVLFSQTIPPSPSPRVQKSLLYICVSCCLAYRVCHYHLSKFHIYALIHCIWCFPFWLTSLCIMGSSFIHLIRTDSNVLFLIVE